MSNWNLPPTPPKEWLNACDRLTERSLFGLPFVGTMADARRLQIAWADSEEGRAHMSARAKREAGQVVEHSAIIEVLALKKADALIRELEESQAAKPDGDGGTT